MSFLKKVPQSGCNVACELHVVIERSKFRSAERILVEELLSSLSVAVPDGEKFPQIYARLFEHTYRAGTPVDTMDLLIATAAVQDEAPLVTRNVKHFKRIPELQIYSY